MPKWTRHRTSEFRGVEAIIVAIALSDRGDNMRWARNWSLSVNNLLLVKSSLSLDANYDVCVCRRHHCRCCRRPAATVSAADFPRETWERYSILGFTWDLYRVCNRWKLKYFQVMV